MDRSEGVLRLLFLEIASVLDEQFHHVGLVVVCGRHQGRVSDGVHHLEHGFVGVHHLLSDSRKAFGARDVHRRQESRRFFGFQIGFAFDQQVDDLQVVLSRGEMKRRVTCVCVIILDFKNELSSLRTDVSVFRYIQKFYMCSFSLIFLAFFLNVYHF